MRAKIDRGTTSSYNSVLGWWNSRSGHHDTYIQSQSQAVAADTIHVGRHGGQGEGVREVGEDAGEH
jgi:hypothetical protein